MVGNENAGRLANRGTKGVRVTRCSLGLPECYLEELLDKWLQKMVLEKCQEEKGMRKLLIGEQPSKTWLAELRKLERR